MCVYKININNISKNVIILVRLRTATETRKRDNDSIRTEGEIRVHRGMLKISLNRARKLNGVA